MKKLIYFPIRPRDSMNEYTVSGINVVRSVELVFDRGRLLYIYSNGFEEKLVLNQHL